MKNTYITAGVIIVVVILAFVFGKNKTEAPQEISDNAVSSSFTLTDGSYKVDTEASDQILYEATDTTAGASKKPKLVVNYTAPATANQSYAFFM